jgi:hypothetical protein
LSSTRTTARRIEVEIELHADRIWHSLIDPPLEDKIEVMNPLARKLSAEEDSWTPITAMN